MKKSLYCLVALLTISIPFNASAQMPTPPKVLLIVREDIKTGMMSPHAVEANGTVNIYAKAKSPWHRLAMTPVAGNENEVTYFWGFNSFADMEQSNKDLDALGTKYQSDFDKTRHEGEDYHALQRDSIAVLREDLSYNTGADLPHMRYMRIQTVRIKPGYQQEFEAARKIVKAAHEKAKIDENMAVFQMVGGAQSGTYLVIIPWKSLGGMSTIPHGKNYQDAMGKDNSEKLDKLTTESVAFESVDVYAFAPQLSYMSEQAVAADPAFWTLKTLPKLAAPAKKAAAKKP